MKNLNLTSFRQDQRLTISQMAVKIGISQSFYEKIEYGDRLPSFNFLAKFKMAFPSADADQIFLSNVYTDCVGK